MWNGYAREIERYNGGLKMEIKRLFFFQSMVILGLSLSGCAAIQGGGSLGEYQKLKDISHESSTIGDDTTSHAELPGMATLDDYLAYGRAAQSRPQGCVLQLESRIGENAAGPGPARPPLYLCLFHREC